MSFEPRELGTLIVVVVKARNLPNLARFGKQHPFCTVMVGSIKHKTKVIQRGGQHPEWDDELRFTIYQDSDDILAEGAVEAANSSLRLKPDNLPPLPVEEVGVVTPATLASKSRQGKAAAKKPPSKVMKIACYADDAREPELIGEAVVPLDEVLKKGELDDYFEIRKGDKYCGEVSLECTFYSNAAPPVKRDVPRPPVLNPNAPIRPQTQSAATGMNLYIPPYGQPARAPSPSPAAAGRPPQGQPQQAPGPAPQQPMPAQSLPPPQAQGRPQGLTHSTSFSELGLPPHLQNAPVAGQPEYPPGQVGGNAAVDALTRPMMSMSLGPSYRPNGQPDVPQQQQPQPQPQPQPYGASPQGPGHAHSHSFDSQPQPQPTGQWVPPLPQPPQPQQSQPPARPLSAIGNYRTPTSDPRMNGVHSVSPSPMHPGHNRTTSTNLFVPGHEQAPQQQGGYSPSADYGVPRPPSAEPTYHQQQGGGSPYHPQTPSAPYTPPSNRRHSSYQFATPPQPTPPPQQPYTAQPYPPQGYPPAPPASAGPYPPTSDYPPVPPAPHKQASGGQQGYSVYDHHSQHSDSAPSFPSGYPPQPPQSYPPSLNQSPYHQSQTPAPQPYPPTSTTPTPQPSSPPSTSTGAYVPWYQQTASLPAPPTPPQPPKPSQHVGYYPSDELYAQQSQPQARPPTTSPYGAPHQPSPPQSTYGAPQPPQQQQPYPPQSPYPPQNQPAYRPTSTYDNNYTSTPPRQEPASVSAPWSHLQQQQQYSNSPPSQTPGHSHTLYYAQQSNDRASSAGPPDFRPTTAASDFRPMTAMSSMSSDTYSQNQHRAPSPLPPSGGGTTTNRDWRSYLASLPTSSPHDSPQQQPLPPPLSQQNYGTPQPPPRPYSSLTQPNQATPPPPPRPPQQDWYNTPPPAVPASIMQDYRPQPPPQPQWR